MKNTCNTSLSFVHWMDCIRIWVLIIWFFCNVLSVMIPRDQNDYKSEERPHSPLQPHTEEEEVEIQYEDEDDIFLTQSLSCPEVTDDQIADYLLKFEDAKWEFNCQSVEMYRLQSNQINHAQMLPHPLDIRFPQYFSSSTIPPKKQFFANVLPPENKERFPTKCQQWKILVIVEE
eukprot:364727_1